MPPVKKKNIRYKILLKLSQEFLWVIIAQLFSIIGSIYFIKILTDRLDPNQYGIFSLLFSVSTFFGQVIYGGLGSALSRFYSVAENQSDLIDYFKNSANIILKLSYALVFIWGIFVIVLLISGYNNLFILTILTLFISIFNGVISVISNVQNASRQRFVVALNNGFGVALKICFTLLAFEFFDVNLKSLLLSLLSASFCTLFLQFVFIRYKWKIDFHMGGNIKSVGNWKNQIWSYTLSVSIWSGFMALYQLSDKWALGYYNSPKEVGVYMVYFQLGYSPTLLVMTNLLAFLSPIIYQKMEYASNDDRRNYINSLTTKLTWFTFCFAMAGSVITYFFHNRIFSFLLDNSYASYSYILPIFVLSAGIFAAGQILNLKMESHMKVKEMNWVKIGTALFGISLNFLLSAFYGLNGVVAALLIYSISNYFGMLRISRRVF